MDTACVPSGFDVEVTLFRGRSTENQSKNLSGWRWGRKFELVIASFQDIYGSKFDNYFSWSSRLCMQGLSRDTESKFHGRSLVYRQADLDSRMERAGIFNLTKPQDNLTWVTPVCDTIVFINPYGIKVRCCVRRTARDAKLIRKQFRPNHLWLNLRRKNNLKNLIRPTVVRVGNYLLTAMNHIKAEFATI